MIVSAAIRISVASNAVSQGDHYAIMTLPAPARHYHIVHACNVLGIPTRQDDQGFLDDTGQYLDRRAALAHAIACGQVDPFNRRCDSRDLFSEDLW